MANETAVARALGAAIRSRPVQRALAQSSIGEAINTIMERLQKKYDHTEIAQAAQQMSRDFIDQAASGKLKNVNPKVIQALEGISKTATNRSALGSQLALNTAQYGRSTAPLMKRPPGGLTRTAAAEKLAPVMRRPPVKGGPPVKLDTVMKGKGGLGSLLKAWWPFLAIEGGIIAGQTAQNITQEHQIGMKQMEVAESAIDPGAIFAAKEAPRVAAQNDMMMQALMQMVMGGGGPSLAQGEMAIG